MALPATDNFNRADSATLGANWTDLFANTMRIASGLQPNAASATTAEGCAYWNPDVFGNDQYSQAVCPAQNYNGPCVRMSGSVGAGNGYTSASNASASLSLIQRMDAGVRTTLSSTGAAIANLHTVKLTAVGTAITLYDNGVSNSTVTDATYASGSAGVWILSGSTPYLDDWEGGNVGAAAATDTWTQAVAGQGNLSRAQRAFSLRAGIEQRLFAPQPDASGPLSTQPDTWVQPIAGQFELSQVARVYSARVRVAQSLAWMPPEDTSGPLATQPDTWTQDIQGTRSLKLQRFSSRLAGAQATLWNFDLPTPTVVQPDLYIQPVVGADALARAGRAWLARTRAANALLWFTPEDASGPLPTQPDLYIQDVQGTRSLRSQRFNSRLAAASWTLWNVDLTAPQVIAPDLYIQPIQGLAALRLAQRRLWLTAAALVPLGWATPFDQPLAPDTWIQPVAGQFALRQSVTSFMRRAIQVSRGLWFTPEDLSAALVAQPDTFVPPIQGMTALAAAALRYSRRAGQAQRRLFVTHDDPPFSVVPFTFGHRSGPIQHGSAHRSGPIQHGSAHRSGPITHVKPKRTM